MTKEVEQILEMLKKHRDLYFAKADGDNYTITLINVSKGKALTKAIKEIENEHRT